MRYTKDRKAETRKYLLEMSGALAKKKGFSASGVDALMEAAGLTSGAFYSHFASKADLFSALVTYELDKSLQMFSDAPPDQDADAWLARQLKRYLTIKHVNSPESGCSLPSLSAEIARADHATKENYEVAIKRIHTVWAQRLGDEQAAWAAISQLVGAILLARAMPSEQAGNEVLDASKGFLQTVLRST